MWIFLGVLAFLILLIIFLLLTPVHLVIKKEPNNEFIISFKYLFLTFGKKSKSNNKTSNKIKDLFGLSKFEKKKTESDAKSKGPADTVKQTTRLLIELFKELTAIFKHCTINHFYLDIFCAGEDAHKTAVSYGECCAAVYSAVGFLNSIIKFKKRRQKINISCNFNETTTVFMLTCTVSIKLFYVLKALLKFVLKEVKHKKNNDNKR